MNNAIVFFGFLFGLFALGALCGAAGAMLLIRWTIMYPLDERRRLEEQNDDQSQ